MKRLIAALLVAASCAHIAQAQNTPPVEAGATLSLEQALSMAGASGNDRGRPTGYAGRFRGYRWARRIAHA